MTNLETSERKLLQIVLIGQPELREMLAQPGLQQLAQRVIARFHLEALSEAETAQYIRHRLAVAGLSGPIPFASDTLRRIHRICRGVPRRINLLCDRALLGAYASNKVLVTRPIVDKAASEVFDEVDGGAASRSAFSRSAPWMALVAGLALGAAAYGTAGWWAGRSVQRPAMPALATSAVSTRPIAAGPASAVAPASPASDSASASATALAPVLASAAPFAAAVSAVVFDPATAFERLPRRDDEAWRSLAERWKAKLDEGDPCAAAQKQQLPCTRMTTTLAVIRQLDRPGIVTLHDASGKPAYAMLIALGADTATLQVGEQSMSASLGALAAVWGGEFATLWRAPAAYRNPLADGSSGQTVEALAAQLAAWFGEPVPAAGRVYDGALKARVSAFQRAQGLKPDGVAGPTTFMQLNRVSGVDEPRLSNGSPTR